MTAPLRRNVLANYVGQGWAGLMALAFIPVYVRVLGMESYGIVGVFTLLQTWATLLDLGLTPMINREMARYVAGARRVQSARDLLHSVVVLAAIGACMVAAVVLASADWMARHWLQLGSREPAEVARALSIAGVLLALRFLEGPYRAALLGMQEHVRLNIAVALLATARWGGVALVIVWWQPSLDAFFGWQAVVSLATILVLRAQTQHAFGARVAPPRFSWGELGLVGRFAGGAMLTTALALVLTQGDKLLLTRSLSLQDFGVYSAAWTVASALYMVISPLMQSYYPRFSGLMVHAATPELRRSYHQAAQLLALCIVPPALMLVFFGGPVLAWWWRDAQLASTVAPFLAWLTLGVLMNGLLHVPHMLAMAAGWVRFSVYVNTVAVAVFLPLLVWSVRHHGALGAAVAWALLNTAILLCSMFYFHGRLLQGERRAWYVGDLGVPLGFSALLCLLVRAAVDDVMAMAWWQLLFLYIAMTILLLLALPRLRHLWLPLVTRRSHGPA